MIGILHSKEVLGETCASWSGVAPGLARRRCSNGDLLLTSRSCSEFHDGCASPAVVALCMAARLAVVQCFGSRASVIFSMMETVARRNAKQRFQSSLEEVWLAKDLLGDVRSLLPLFLCIIFDVGVLRCSLSWCRMLHFEVWTQVSLVSVEGHSASLS